MQQSVATPHPRPFDEESVYRTRIADELLRTWARYRLIGAFAGAGRMSRGFSKAFGHTFMPVWANA